MEKGGAPVKPSTLADYVTDEKVPEPSPPPRGKPRPTENLDSAESGKSSGTAASEHVEPDNLSPRKFRKRDLTDPLVRKALFKKYGIEVGPYKELQKIDKEGYQREHFVPHSNFMTRSAQSGEARSKVPIGKEFGEYNEGDAITYFVYDDQSKGTEHRYPGLFVTSLEQRGNGAR